MPIPQAEQNTSFSRNYTGNFTRAESRVVTQPSPKSGINNTSSAGIKKKYSGFLPHLMLSKSKQPDPLPRLDISGSLVLHEAFFQRGLEEKNVKTESPATKRKTTLNIQIQLWILLFFHLQATNDLLKNKMSVAMLETFQRECFEPPPISTSKARFNCGLQVRIISKVSCPLIIL